MTEIAFHFNAPDKLSYACRLLRKAVAGKARVVVTGERELLSELDVALWTFSALEFVPHCHETAEPAVREMSPVLLAETATTSPHHDVLLNLGGSVPAGFERYNRVIEVVGEDPSDRSGARGRWKHYADRGYAITRHDLAQKGA